MILLIGVVAIILGLVMFFLGWELMKKWPRTMSEVMSLGVLVFFAGLITAVIGLA